MIRTFNPTGERVFGYAQDEVVGQRIDLLLPKIAAEETIPEALARLAASLGDTALRPGRARAVGAAPERRPVPGRDRRQQGAAARAREMFVLCLRDVTERRESEQAMRDSAARYRSLVDHAPDAIVVLDVGHRALRRCQRQRRRSSSA